MFLQTKTILEADGQRKTIPEAWENDSIFVITSSVEIRSHYREEMRRFLVGYAAFSLEFSFEDVLAMEKQVFLCFRDGCFNFSILLIEIATRTWRITYWRFYGEIFQWDLVAATTGFDKVSKSNKRAPKLFNNIRRLSIIALQWIESFVLKSRIVIPNFGNHRELLNHHLYIAFVWQ